MSKLGFLHQLRLLLWKNYILKKRNPLRIAFEVLIPLVLFLILMIIRLHRIPQPHSEDEFVARALPSAGIVPLLQSFCPNANAAIEGDNFQEFPNASIGAILDDIADIYNSPAVNGLHNLKAFQKDIRSLANDKDQLPVLNRQFRDFGLHDVLLRPGELEDYLVTNLSLSEKFVHGLIYSEINGSEASKILLEKRQDILKDYFLYVHPIKYPTHFKSLQKSVIAQALFDPRSLTRGPTWLRLLTSYSGLSKALDLAASDVLGSEWLQEVFKREFLGPSTLRKLYCGDEFTKLFLSPELSRQEMEKGAEQLCNLSNSQMSAFSNQLTRNLNWSAVVDEMRLEQGGLDDYRDTVIKMQQRIKTLAELETLIKKSSDIAQKFHFNLTLIDRMNSSRHHRMLHYAAEIWRVIDPILCGPPQESTSDEDADSDFRRLFRRRESSVRALKFMLYTLTNNPRILYAPNTTDVNRVIAKAGHLLKLIESTRTYATTWLNISKNLRARLMNPKTQHYLHDIAGAARKFPFIYNDWTTNLTQHSNDTNSTIDQQIHRANLTVLKHLKKARGHLQETVNNLLEDKYDRIPLLEKTLFIDKVAKAWLVFLKPFKFDIFYGFANESQLMDYVVNTTGAKQLKRHVLSAILFDNVGKDGKLPKHVLYRIRMDGRLMTSTAKIRSRYWYPGPQWHIRYLYYGYIWLQDSIERALIEVMAGKNVTSPGLYINEMPYPCYLKDRFMFVIQYVMPLCMTLSFIYSVALLVQSIVYEKEQRLKEVMKMMGLSNAVHWMAWFITSMVTLGLNIMLLTIILKSGGILQYSDPSITFLFLSLSALATTLFCFLISVFFSKAKLAAACGGIIYFITYMPYVFISIREGGSHVKISGAWKTFSSLLSTTAFGLGARYFALFEQNGQGLQWDNIATSPLLDDDFNLGQVFAMLIVDSFIYGILAWYIEAVHPGAYGLPRPWYFPFQPSYWCGESVTKWMKRKTFQRMYHRMQSMVGEDTLTDPPGLLATEREPMHLPLGVVIQNLVKVYRNGQKPAVDNLALNLYEGQITSFLGHNGAGKTTTMSILTGLFPPTSGTAIIYGYDIRHEMDKIRTSLGMCPQHNVLFDRMTVEEHLWFYARLKGMGSDQVKVEMNRILEDVGLPTKRHSLVDTLSGGMQRKLSVAMAFVGGSRTVILDEPTAGVDPYARRAIWDLLVKYKQGRTILLSTHFMDEADILGDRIAIISHGKLRCCGSSLFLKSTFGDGYHLTLVKKARCDSKPEAGNHQSPTSGGAPVNNLSLASTAEIEKYIASFVPSSQLICETQHELSFILPDKDIKRGMLRRLFLNLEENKEKLGSKSFGLTDTTLEEVFLKVTEAAMQDEDSEEDDLVCDVDLPSLSPELDAANDAAVRCPSDPVSDPVSPPSDHETVDATSNGSELLLPDTNRLRGKKGHRRSFSSDFYKEKQCTSPMANTVCAHRRTPSGGYCGHRRALSTDYSLDRKQKRPDLAAAHAPIDKVKKSHHRTPSNTSHISQGSGVLEFDDIKVSLVSNAALRWKQFYGLLIKRFHHGRRNFKGVISQIFLPAIFICIAMTVALSRQGINTGLPKLILSPSMFRPPPNYIPVNNELQIARRYAKKLENTLTLPSGVGADCVLRRTNLTMYHTYRFKTLKRNLRNLYDELCAKQVSDSYDVVFDVSKDIYEPFNETYNESSHHSNHKWGPGCHCSKDFRSYLCDPGVEGNPQSYTTVTRDTVLNVTGRDMQKYLKYTTFRFKRHRYGALTFGLNRKFAPVKLQRIPNDDIQRLFVKHVAKAWFNSKGYHAMPTYLNVLNNAILRANVDPQSQGNPAAYGITAINHPFNISGNVFDEESMRQGTDVVIAIFVIIAMSFVPASFVVFLVMERASKAKHLQFVSGVDPTIYWISNYIWDILNYMVPASACMMILYFFQVPAYSSPTNFPATCWLFVMYGWSITPLMYPASFLFREASTAYVVMIVLNLFVGITCTVTTFILQMFPDDPPLVTAYNTVKIVALAFPNYCLGRGLMDLAFNEYVNEYYKLVGEFGSVRSPFAWELVTRSLVAMFTEGLLFFLVTLLIEYRFFIKKRKQNAIVGQNAEDEDEDVAYEKQRVLEGETSEDTLVIENLTKVYRSRKTGKQLAVDNLCLGVPRGECFGLLGVNGAGKTTTFKMLTGDTSVTAGKARVKSYSVIEQAAKVHKHIGYCPQFDALIDEMTGREHLVFYARLRGVPESKLNEVVNSSLKKLALMRYADRPSRTYSGGNKRKLSAAIALLGNPSLVFMDEPTTGMDPGARRFLWNVILGIVKEGTKSIVLTSHSMEECEALCSRLAIMVNGRFKCIGSTQHLKNKFGEGYIVTIRVKGDLPDLKPVERFISENLPEAVLKECHHNMLQYQVPSSPTIKLADLFSYMEEAEDHLDVEDYSISQTTLDNVFINFAKLQTGVTSLDQSSALSNSSLSRLRASSLRDWLCSAIRNLRRARSPMREVQFSRLSASDAASLREEDMDEQIVTGFAGTKNVLSFHEPVEA